MERHGFVCGAQRQAFCQLLLALTTTGSIVPGQGHFPQPQVPHVTRGNLWKTQMPLGLVAKIIWWQKAGPTQHHRHQISASDHGPQWTQHISATQTQRSLETRAYGC